MIPMCDRRLTPGKVRVCRLKISGDWVAEKINPIHEQDGYKLVSHTSESFSTHPEALAKALSWLPPQETP